MKRLLICLLFLSASSAMAVDGVFEINQLCVAFGCFDGDDPGFPVTLANNGSYRLTSNLVVNDINTTAIRMSTSQVTLDLNGFAIEGPCISGCASPGTGNGVSATPGISQQTVKNGTIRGMGLNGLKCDGCRIENIHSRDNRGNGMEVNEAMVLNSIVKGNDLNGIVAFTSVVENAVVTRNGNFGIEATDSIITRVRARFNGPAPEGAGIQCDGCSVFDSIITNENFGIVFENNSVWGRNLLYNNTADLGGFDTPTAVNPNRCGGVTC